MKGNHTLYEKARGEYLPFLFCDFTGSYQYKRLEFSVAVNNIFNTTLFTLKTLSAANSYEQKIPLRGREFLVSLRVKF